MASCFLFVLTKAEELLLQLFLVSKLKHVWTVWYIIYFGYWRAFSKPYMCSKFKLFDFFLRKNGLGCNSLNVLEQKSD